MAYISYYNRITSLYNNAILIIKYHRALFPFLSLGKPLLVPTAIASSTYARTSESLCTLLAHSINYFCLMVTYGDGQWQTLRHTCGRIHPVLSPGCASQYFWLARSESAVATHSRAHKGRSMRWQHTCNSSSPLKTVASILGGGCDSCTAAASASVWLELHGSLTAVALAGH